jgi:hypothetical protein
VDFTLGSDAKEDFSSEAEYWAAVRRRLEKSLKAGLRIKQIRYVLVVGESAEDPKFRDTLPMVLFGLLGYMPELLYAKDPVHAAARGAAKFARRGGHCDPGY